MPHPQLDNLVKIGYLKIEPAAEAELDGLLRSGVRRLDDAAREDLSLESRFDLAYNAAHALALAALRFRGYRSESRYLVFQCLQHTSPNISAAISLASWRSHRNERSEHSKSLDRCRCQASLYSAHGVGGGTESKRLDPPFLRQAKISLC